MNFLFFKTQSSEEKNESFALQKLLSLTKSIITRDDIVSNIAKKYNAQLEQGGDKEINASIQMYLALEQFIITNKPLIIKKNYTKEELRTELIKEVDINLLPDAIRLLFIPKSQQLYMIYKNLPQDLAAFISNQTGINKLLILISTFNKNFPGKEIMLDSNYLKYDALLKNLSGMEQHDIIIYFKELTNILFSEIVTSFGQNVASDIIQKEYLLVKERYDYDIITYYLKIIPNGVLDKERVAFMAREDLEKEAKRAVEERIRTETLEKSSKELIQTVDELKKAKDTVTNLLYDSQELEKDLRSERDRINAIISSMNEGLFVVNTDYKITLINHSAINILHLSEEGFMGRDLSSIFSITKDGKLLDKSETPIAISLTTGKNVIADVEENLYYVHPNGMKFPIMVSSAPLFDLHGTIIGAVLTFRDISETLKYEQTLRDEKTIIEQKVSEQTKVINQEKEELQKAVEEVKVNYLNAQKSEAKLMASIKNLTIGFISTHSNDTISSINNAAKFILDLKNEEVSLEDIDTKLQGILSLKEKLQEVRDKKVVIDIKECLVGEKFLHIIITPVLLSEQANEYIGSVIIIEDITESKALEKTKDEFFAIASHDLRTPLTAIRGYTSLMQTVYKDKITDQSIHEMINNIDLAAIRLIDLVNEYLNVTRLENGKLKYINEDILLVDLINETVKEIQTLAEKKHLTLSLVNEIETPFKIYADREKMKQVITNLIGNSIKFTDSGSITIKLTQNGDNVELRVIDTGKGIPASFQQKLFKKYQLQGSNAYIRDNAQGSGLGLFISKRLIENMQGTIILESSEENKGTTFLITLPIKK